MIAGVAPLRLLLLAEAKDALSFVTLAKVLMRAPASLMGSMPLSDRAEAVPGRFLISGERLSWLWTEVIEDSRIARWATLG